MSRVSQINKTDIEIPRTNSPYDYHVVKDSDTEIIPATKSAPKVSITPTPTENTTGDIKSPIPTKPACLPDCATTLGHDLKRREEQKHLWYCEHCLIMDEASGVNDAWGFSSSTNSRTHSPQSGDTTQTTKQPSRD